MNRKLITLSFLFLVTAAVATSLLIRSEETASASTATLAAAPVAALCESPFVRNVRITQVGRSDFDIFWEYAPPDPCLQPTKFDVSVTVKRNNGRVRTDSKTVAGSARNVRINLAAIGDAEFKEWRSSEVESIRRTGRDAVEEVMAIVAEKIGG